MYQVCFDTAALNRALDTLDIERLVAYLKHKNLQMVAPEIVMMEAFKHHDLGQMYARFTRLQRLVSLAGPHFGISEHLPEMLRRERSRVKRDVRVVLNSAFLHNVMQCVDIAEFSAWHSQLRSTEVQEWFSANGKGDLDALARINQHPEMGSWTVEECEKHLRDWIPQVSAKWNKTVFFKSAVKSRHWRQKIENNPTQYPAIVLFCVSCTLNGAGVAARLKKRVKDLRHWKHDKNSLTDIMISMASVRAHAFVVTDSDFKARLEHISGQGYFPPKLWGEEFFALV